MTKEEQVNLEEIKEQYRRAAAELEVEMERKALLKRGQAEMYNDVVADVEDTMSWVYEQVHEISKCEATNDVQLEKIKQIEENIAKIEVQLIKAKEVIENLQEQSKELIDDKSKAKLEQKIKDYTKTVKNVEKSMNVIKKGGKGYGRD